MGEIIVSEVKINKAIIDMLEKFRTKNISEFDEKLNQIEEGQNDLRNVYISLMNLFDNADYGMLIFMYLQYGSVFEDE